MQATFFASPQQAQVEHQTDAPVIAVKYGERGYYPIYTVASPELLNYEDGWTPEEVESAIAGSMHGWDCPAAQAAREAVKRRKGG